MLLALCNCAAAGAATYSGKLEVLHADDFAHGRGQTTWTLRAHGKRVPIRPTALPKAVSGDRVKVRGRRLGRWVEGKVIRTGGPRVRAASALGNHSVAVILVNFATDSNPEPWTPAEVRGRIFDDSDSTAAFYSDESYGDITLSGDVFGWYRIAGPADTCDYSLWASQAITAAQNDGHDLSGYGHIQFVFPHQASCGWAGLGYMPGTETWLNGVTEPWVAAHELGHNMGLHHASSYSCTSGGAYVTWSSNCTASEYGDPYDVMGNNSQVFHDNAWHLAQLGVIPSSNIQSITSSGTYTIKSALHSGPGTNLLRVPTGGTPARYYDLSIRESGGVFDSLLPASITSGVSVHWDPAMGALTQSLLLDGTPDSGAGFSDAALPAGSTFSDGQNSITVDSVSPGEATVSVVLGDPHDVDPPTAPGNLSATGVQGGADLSWSASTDNVGVSGYRIVRDNAIVATTTGLSYSDRNLAPSSSHSYRVQAIDAAGNGTLSALRWVTVPAAPDPGPGPGTNGGGGAGSSDTTPPAITLASPRNRARLRGSARILAAAQDAGGLSRIELYIDGRRVAFVWSSRLRWTWSLRRVRRGAHTIRVRAVDASGNVSSRSAGVRVVR